MCEFKVIKKNDGSQILEDIVILSYTEDNELLFKDIIGMGEILKSALIVDVNTLNQTCVVLEHPLIQDFVGMIEKINSKTISKEVIEKFEKQLVSLKESII
ncbi:MAG: CooT family nickel-binding protein [Promethearchaeota archaeon]|jgi:predicted RNA-binding protein|nr:MAG: CooT family nickel-binding protein [Candidatus Lokiarchaeota archaeon]